eukprot:10494934-Alexandrium_andersonii.AAC.1
MLPTSPRRGAPFAFSKRSIGPFSSASLNFATQAATSKIRKKKFAEKGLRVYAFPEMAERNQAER